MSSTVYADRPQIVPGKRSILTGIDSGQRARMQQSRSFRFGHSLGCNPDLGLPEIVEITKTLLDAKRFNQVFYRSGGGQYGLRYSTPESASDVLETVRSMHGPSPGWIRLTRVDEVDDRLAKISERFTTICLNSISAI